ncbi:GTP-binding protein [Candidatus Woesearchaeota archaeon]|nr:GTP-binding protein [Candidatus Woesearchaeota archaeon]
MALPHVIQMQLIKKRIKGKEGKQKINELKQIMQELPGYKSGHYADIRKWIQEEIAKTKTRTKVKHQDWIGVKKEGAAQIVLVGAPNIGKSSLLKALSDIQIKVANYAFTTLKPIPAIIKYEGTEVQLVEIPGLIKGAHEDKGGGKRLLGIIRGADGIILMHDLSRNTDEVKIILNELDEAGIEKPMIIAANKIDLGTENLESLRKEFPDKIIIPVSVKQGIGLEKLKKQAWNLTGLIKVYTKDKKQPIALPKGATVKQLAEKIHKDFVKRFKFAIITGTSAKFPKQRAGLGHVLEDGDVTEIIT